MMATLTWLRSSSAIAVLAAAAIFAAYAELIRPGLLTHVLVFAVGVLHGLTIRARRPGRRVD